jgi:hypothetical protein
MDEKRIARFWSRVDRSTPDGCWEWQGARGESGHGVGWDGKRTRLAHRIAWFLTHGKWPDECVCHRCDNPPCCNPAHLFEGDRAANLADMRSKGRAAPMPTQPRGSQHSHAKLAESDIPLIRARLAAGEKAAAIAADYGVTSSNIRAIHRGKTWSFVA